MYMKTMATAEDLLQCEHRDTQPVLRMVAGGRQMVWEQCQFCGKGIQALKKSDFNCATLPLWDVELVQHRDATLREYYDQRAADFRADAEEQREAAQAEFAEKYAAYLRSPEWARVKRRALVRDNFRCQHCFKEVNESTSNAHHVLPYGYETFRAYGYSLTYEVVTLCIRCHAAAHGKPVGKP